MMKQNKRQWTIIESAEMQVRTKRGKCFPHFHISRIGSTSLFMPK